MFTTRPEIRGTYGMVSSTHYLATMAGWSMLEKGGNAFDAAVATGLALQVVHHTKMVPVATYRLSYMILPRGKQRLFVDREYHPKPQL